MENASGDQEPASSCPEPLRQAIARRGGSAFWLVGTAQAESFPAVAATFDEATRAGLACVRGICFGEGGVPYAPFITVLDGLVRLARERCPEVLAQHASVLTLLQPQLGTPEPALPPANERARLQGAMLALTAAASRGGLLMVVEEAHEADPLSRELLTALSRQARGIGLLLVAVSRGPGPTSTERAHFTALPVAAAVAASARDRIRDLASDTLVLLRLTALAGSVVDAELLQLASGLSNVDGELERLRAAGLVVPGPRGTLRVAGAVQQAILEGLSGESRARCHRTLARAFESRLVPGTEAPLEIITTLAHHALAAGPTPRAIGYALAAGARHARLHAWQTAEGLFETALDALRAQPAPSEAAMCEALGHLGDVYRVSGRYELARRTYEEALPLAEALGDHVRVSAWCTSLAQAHQGLDDLAAALAASERALAASRGDARSAARALLTNARLRLYRGEVLEARARLSDALACAREAGDRSREGEALAFLGYMQLTTEPRQPRAGLESLRRAIAHQSALDDKVGLIMSQLILGDALAIQGRYHEAESAFTTALALTEITGNPAERGIALVNLAGVALERGAPQAAVEHAGAARANALALDNKFQLALAEALSAAACAELGTPSAARRSAEQAQSLARELGNAYLQTQVAPQVARVLLWLGHPDRARAALEALDERLATTGDRALASRVSVLLAEAAWRLGEAEEAEVQAQTALHRAEAGEAPADRARALQIKARLAFARGDAAAARQHAEAALAIARALESRLLEAELHGLLGDMLPRTEAHEAYGHMAALARAAGSAWHLALAECALAAAEPDAERARALTQAARQHAEAVLATLNAAERQTFLRYPERREVFALVTDHGA